MTAVCRFLVIALVAGALHAGTVYVQPIHVCDQNGQNCGDPAERLFQEETNAIWAQAGITVSFLNWGIVSDLDVTGAVDVTLPLLYGLSDLTPRYPTTALVFMWFASSLSGCGPAWGCTLVNDIFIADSVFSTNGGAGRIDTIAHELGHTLGLPHCNENGGTCTSDHLMATGGVRIPAANLSQIAPAGPYDKLSASEILTADESPYVTPEPATLGLLLFGGLMLIPRLRRAVIRA